eukprot:symbB.v1.2.027402.t1/scaffold2808.1/size69842/4
MDALKSALNHPLGNSLRNPAFPQLVPAVNHGIGKDYFMGWRAMHFVSASPFASNAVDAAEMLIEARGPLSVNDNAMLDACATATRAFDTQDDSHGDAGTLIVFGAPTSWLNGRFWTVLAKTTLCLLSLSTHFRLALDTTTSEKTFLGSKEA